MSPETLDSLDKDSLKPLVLQLLAQNNELPEQIKTLKRSTSRRSPGPLLRRHRGGVRADERVDVRKAVAA